MTNNKKGYLKEKASDLFKAPDLSPYRTITGFIAGTLLAGTLAYSFQDKILAPVAVPVPEPKAPIVLNLKYPFCSADQMPMKLETDVVAWVKESDLPQVFDDIGEINKISESRFSDFVDATAGDKLKRISNSNIPVMNGATLLTQSLKNGEVAAKGAVTAAFIQIGVGVELETYEAKVSLNSSNTQAVLDCVDRPKVQI